MIATLKRKTRQQTGDRLAPKPRVSAASHNGQATPALSPTKPVPAHSKRRRANVFVSPKDALPVAANKNGRLATMRLSSKVEMPAVHSLNHERATVPLTPTENVSAHENGDGEKAIKDVSPKSAPSSSIPLIRELQSIRVSTVRAQIVLMNKSRSSALRYVGWQWNMQKKQRAKLNKLAAAIVESIESQLDPNSIFPNLKKKFIPPPAGYESAAIKIAPFVKIMFDARAPIVSYRERLETQLRQAVEQLPVWEKVKDIKGFAELSLAAIVGEAGDLSNYSNPGKLWKRMGLAVINGKSQRRVTDPIEAAKQGYNPRRRSTMYVIGETLVKQNDGIYRQLYDERRAYECARHPEFDKGIDPKTGKHRVTMHCHRLAKRYMEKRLLRELWRAWRDTKAGA